MATHMPTNTDSPVLQVEELRTQFRTLDGILKAVDGLTFALQNGKCLGIVGESGCGKSVAARSILRLLPQAITTGQILYRPKDSDKAVDLVKLDAKGRAIRRIRGREIAMIFQEPMTSLTPVYT